MLCFIFCILVLDILVWSVIIDKLEIWSNIGVFWLVFRVCFLCIGKVVIVLDIGVNIFVNLSLVIFFFSEVLLVLICVMFVVILVLIILRFVLLFMIIFWLIVFCLNKFWLCCVFILVSFCFVCSWVSCVFLLFSVVWEFCICVLNIWVLIFISKLFFLIIFFFFMWILFIWFEICVFIFM